MVKNPLVSIIIPMYNQRDLFLRECIQSAITQTYKNIEIVISDNHSNNNATEILHEFKSLDCRIRIVKPPYFLNMSENFLFAFNLSEGQYSCYLSSDDILMPNCVEVLIEKMEKYENAVFAHGKALYFDKFHNEKIEWNYFSSGTGEYLFNNEIALQFLNFNYVCFAGCLIRNSKLKYILKFYKLNKPFLPHFLDLQFTLKMFELGSVYFENSVLSKVRIENDHRNTLFSNLISSAILIWEDYDKSNLFLKMKLTDENTFNYTKELQFKKYLRFLLVEYSAGDISQKDFKNALIQLKDYYFKGFNILNIAINIGLLAPSLSKIIIKLFIKINHVLR